ncbi:MAG: hypothetical protein QY322_03620 [bacterium]|nr:MAG: hypothetical protein QY322_03620 [bacterium]
MTLQSEALEEFKKLYFKEFGVSLTDEQALGYSSSLIGLVKAVYGQNLPYSKTIDNINNQIQN